MCIKLFQSSNIDLVKESQSYFRRVLPSFTVKDFRNLSLYDRLIIGIILFVVSLYAVIVCVCFC